MIAAIVPISQHACSAPCPLLSAVCPSDGMGLLERSAYMTSCPSCSIQRQPGDLNWLVGREELQRLDVRRQRINLWVIYLAVLGVAIAILETELLWHNRNIPVMSFQMIKLVNSGVTLLLFYMILQ